jgi:NAD(P)-dependent dehydrogenase (short-subunit alcohol dehydrogenase family)
MAFTKGHKRLGGRKKGAVDKTTALVRDVIEQAAAALGGVDRLVAWAGLGVTLVASIPMTFLRPTGGQTRHLPIAIRMS